MECPYCGASARYRDRTGRRCPTCRRVYALDPRENALRLHDRRLRRLADRLGADGLRYTDVQLWYAASARALRAAAGRKVYGDGGVIASAIALTWFGTPGVVVGIVDGRPDQILFGIGVGVVVTVVGVRRIRTLRRRRIDPPMTIDDFRARVLRRWAAIYGAPPPGLVDDVRPSPPVPSPVLAIVAPDQGVRACLVANGVPESSRIAVVASAADAPPAGPVIVAHDASIGGYLFAERVRAAAGPRVVGALVPRPRAVMASRTAVVLRGDRPMETDVAAAHATGRLTGAEVAWLARGWWSPVAALGPAALIARVERIVGDREAAAVGFLTWADVPPGNERESG